MNTISKTKHYIDIDNDDVDDDEYDHEIKKTKFSYESSCLCHMIPSIFSDNPKSCKLCNSLFIENITVDEYKRILQHKSNELTIITQQNSVLPNLNILNTKHQNLNKILRIIFNSLVFKNYDFSKDSFQPELKTILYEQIYKVYVCIQKIETIGFVIYFGFPFYISISINIEDKIFISRKDIYEQLEKQDELDNINYYALYTEFNSLDIITVVKFINLIMCKYFKTGFDLLCKLINILEQYKILSDNIEFNKIKINFKKFVGLYKKIIINISNIPFN